MLFSALRGLWRYFLVTDKLSATMRIAKRVYSLARDQNDSALMIGGLQRFGSHALLSGRYRVGASTRDAQCSNLALGKCTVIRSKKSIAPAVFCLSHEALSEWHLGDACCQSTMVEAIALSKELHVCTE